MVQGTYSPNKPTVSGFLPFLAGWVRNPIESSGSSHRPLGAVWPNCRAAEALFKGERRGVPSWWLQGGKVTLVWVQQLPVNRNRMPFSWH